MNTPPRSVVLIPGFMLNETLWDEFGRHLPEDWEICHASLAGGQTHMIPLEQPEELAATIIRWLNAQERH